MNVFKNKKKEMKTTYMLESRYYDSHKNFKTD